jgi:hypothetical protein
MHLKTIRNMDVKTVVNKIDKKVKSVCKYAYFLDEYGRIMNLGKYRGIVL